MASESDLKLDLAKFDPGNEDAKTRAVNEKLIQITKNGTSWVDVGAPAYRQMRLEGKTPFPKPTVLPQGQSFEIPSREASRMIPCRVFHPKDMEKGKCKGVIMHIHGGGWVLMDHETSDPLLERYANKSNCVTISIGYRLAPEDPFPAGPEDCYDAAEWLVDHAESEFGGPLRFIGGESAGGHLSLLCCYRLLTTRPAHSLTGLLLHFGVFDLSCLPKVISFPDPLILNHTALHNFWKAFIPDIYPPTTYNHTLAIKSPEVSPFYQELEQWRGKLPAALFTCGSQDCLLEDSVFMAAKWAMAGGKQVLKVVEGGCHGYIAFPPDTYPPAKDGNEATLAFIKEVMS